MVQPMNTGLCAFRTREDACLSTGDKKTTAASQPRGGYTCAKRAGQGVWNPFLWLGIAAVLIVLFGGVRGMIRAVTPLFAAKPVFIVPIRAGRGDTLWSLACRYGDPHTYILERVDALAQANHFSTSARLLPGQRVLVPVGNPVEVARLQRMVTQYAPHKPM